MKLIFPYLLLNSKVFKEACIIHVWILQIHRQTTSFCVVAMHFTW